MFAPNIDTSLVVAIPDVTAGYLFWTPSVSQLAILSILDGAWYQYYIRYGIE